MQSRDFVFDEASFPELSSSSSSDEGNRNSMMRLNRKRAKQLRRRERDRSSVIETSSTRAIQSSQSSANIETTSARATRSSQSRAKSPRSWTFGIPSPPGQSRDRARVNTAVGDTSESRPVSSVSRSNLSVPVRGSNVPIGLESTGIEPTTHPRMRRTVTFELETDNGASTSSAANVRPEGRSFSPIDPYELPSPPHSSSGQDRVPSRTFRQWYELISVWDDIILPIEELLPRYSKYYDLQVPERGNKSLSQCKNVERFSLFLKLIAKAAGDSSRSPSRSSDAENVNVSPIRPRRVPVSGERVDKSQEYSQVVDNSLQQLFHEQKITNWGMHPFEPKSDGVFRVGELAGYIEEFNAFADNYNCDDNQKLFALRFKSGELIRTTCNDAIRDGHKLKTFNDVVKFLTKEWDIEKNPVVVETKFRAMKRESSETKLQFIRRLQRFSLNVTNVENYKDPARAREDMILQTISTGVDDRELRTAAEALIGRSPKKNKLMSRVSEMLKKAAAADSVDAEDAARAGVVSKVEPQRITDPAEYKKLHTKRKRDESRDEGNSSKMFASSRRPDRPRCKKCTKHHNPQDECPKCNNCGIIGHFARQTIICDQMRRQRELGSQSSDKQREVSSSKSHGQSEKSTVKKVEGSKVSGPNYSDDDTFYS